MDVRLESTLRTIGVFLSVFFTIRWGAKSPIQDELWMTVVAILAVIAGFRVKWQNVQVLIEKSFWWNSSKQLQIEFQNVFILMHRRYRKYFVSIKVLQSLCMCFWNVQKWNENFFWWNSSKQLQVDFMNLVILMHRWDRKNLGAMKVCKVSKTLCRCAPATAAMPHAGVTI